MDQVQSYMENNKVNLANLAMLIAILNTAFGNPNRVAKAKSKLSILQQSAVVAPVCRGFLLFFYFISILSVILLFMRKCRAKGTCFFLAGLCKQNYAGDVLRAKRGSRQGRRGQHQHHGQHYHR